MKTAWKPLPKQALMMSRAEDEGFYGGAAGGGKSDYLIIEALRQVDKPCYRGLILRKTVPELEQLIERAQVYYRQAYRNVKFNATKHTFTFPSGAKIQYSSLFRSPDKVKFQGKQFEFIGFDELTHFFFDEYDYLRSRNRANGPGMRVYMRSTGNPGGVGHGWVKSYFVRAGEPGRTVWTKNEVVTPSGEIRRFVSSKIFIPSSVFDNRILLENDPEYLKRLAALSEADRNALLYGNWDSFEGQVFTEFIDDPAHYNDRRFTHVIAPFKVPSSWKIIRSLDWGFTKPYSVGWHAVDNDGRYYRIRERYGCRADKPNTGLQKDFAKVANEIRQIEENDPNLRGRQIIGVADPAIFTDNGSGTSIAAGMAKYNVYFSKADNSRLAGKMQYHYRLAFDDSGVPMYQVFSNCHDFIRTIPNLVYSETQPEDIDTDGEDHIYDESRYAIMQNVINPRVNVMQPKVRFDPLDIDKTLLKRYLR